MSKSKSKSKSKQVTFPNQYWRPDFKIYTYYPGLFKHGRDLLAVAVEAPPQDGDAVAEEIEELLDRQRNLNQNFNQRERRREEIEWEIDHLSRSYQTTLLTSPDTYPKTSQLMNTMSDLALVPVMHFKEKFMRARPNQVDTRIEPLIEVPGHPAYPSGHSTQNFLIAHVLSEVIGDDAELIARVFAIARRVAENREWAGLHYASDTQAGEELARDIFPIMRRALEEPIKEAIKEWQELELEAGALPEPAALASDGPFAGTHFRQHQWNLKNWDRGVDINVLDAWKQLEIWQGDASPNQPPIRVALIDLAVDLEHPALAGRFDHDAARNLDYPNVARDDWGTYRDAFGSSSSAHAIACAGIIAADAKQVKLANGQNEEVEPGCLGIAPHCKIVPYRAMTLAEPVLHKRQILARAVLEAATGVTFVEHGRSRQDGRWTARWTVGDEKGGRRADVLLFPLPLEPLPEQGRDPLPLALAFAAGRIPVIIPSGNKGTSSLSYPCEPGGYAKDPTSIDELSRLFDLGPDSVRIVFGGNGKGDHQIIEDLILALRKKSAVITVGACNDQGRRSRYSQYGEGLTLVAPSDDVVPFPSESMKSTALKGSDGTSAYDGAGVAGRPKSIATTDLRGIGGYMQDESHYTLSDKEFGFGGTSAAAAQVTGVIALMLQANPKLSPSDVHGILCETARTDLLVADDGGASAAEFGHGLVDAAHAVEKAREKVQRAAT